MATVPTTLWHSKPLFAPKALHFLVIDCQPSARARGVGWLEVAPVTQQANCSLTPARATGDLRPPAGVPGQNASIRDPRERNFLQFRMSQKPLERGVFTLTAVEPLDLSARPGLVTRQLRRPSRARPTVRSSGRPKRSITTGGRSVELRVNSRYRGVNTRCPGVNS